MPLASPTSEVDVVLPLPSIGLDVDFDMDESSKVDIF